MPTTRLPDREQVIDRSDAARCLAKAIAYKQCGKDGQAQVWAAELVRVLQCADILAVKS